MLPNVFYLRNAILVVTVMDKAFNDILMFEFKFIPFSVSDTYCLSICPILDLNLHTKI